MIASRLCNNKTLYKIYKRAFWNKNIFYLKIYIDK